MIRCERCGTEEDIDIVRDIGHCPGCGRDYDEWDPTDWHVLTDEELEMG